MIGTLTINDEYVFGAVAYRRQSRGGCIQFLYQDRGTYERESIHTHKYAIFAFSKMTNPITIIKMIGKDPAIPIALENFSTYSYALKTRLNDWYRERTIRVEFNTLDRRIFFIGKFKNFGQLQDGKYAFLFSYRRKETQRKNLNKNSKKKR